MSLYENIEGPNVISIVTPFPQRPRGLGFLGGQAGKEQGKQPSPLSAPHLSG